MKLAAKRGKPRVYSPSEIQALPWSLAAGPIPRTAMATRKPHRGTAIFATFIVAASVTAVAGSYMSTLAGWVPVDGERVLIERSTHPLDSIPIGETVVATETPTDRTFIGKALTNIQLPNAVIATIIAGPGGQVTGDRWTSTGGRETQLPSRYKNGPIGTGQYISICDKGACEVGALLTIDAQQIVGFTGE